MAGAGFGTLGFGQARQPYLCHPMLRALRAFPARDMLPPIKGCRVAVPKKELGPDWATVQAGSVVVDNHDLNVPGEGVALSKTRPLADTKAPCNYIVRHQLYLWM